MKQRTIALLAALALTLTLLAGCGARQEDPPVPDPAPAQDQTEPPVSDPGLRPAEPEPAQTPAPVEDDETPGGEASPAVGVEVPPEEPAPDPEEPPEPESQAPPAQPEPQPEPAPVETAPEDGSYTAAVALAGGTGRATVSSPAALRCEGGKFYATIVWSSPNFDYMKVDGEKYELVGEPGANSTFEIPVSAFDQPLAVIADTVAMSEPHEVEYTLTFDSATLQKQ